MPRPPRLFTASLLAVWGCFLMACSYGCPSHEKMEKELGEANAQWGSGSKAEAVRRYKALYGNYYTGPAEMELLLSRIVDFAGAGLAQAFFRGRPFGSGGGSTSGCLPDSTSRIRSTIVVSSAVASWCTTKSVGIRSPRSMSERCVRWIFARSASAS